MLVKRQNPQIKNAVNASTAEANLPSQEAKPKAQRRPEKVVDKMAEEAPYTAPKSSNVAAQPIFCSKNMDRQGQKMRELEKQQREIQKEMGKIPAGMRGNAVAPPRVPSLPKGANQAQAIKIERPASLNPVAVSKPPLLTGPSQITLNARSGRSFQDAVHDYLRIPENHKGYSATLRDGRTVVTKPDLPLQYGVTDIKNVKYVTFKEQVQAQTTLAGQKETSFNLIISPNTQKISKNLWEKIMDNGGKVFEFNPETQTMIERIVEGNKVLR